MATVQRLSAQALSGMDEEDCGKRYLCELAAGDSLDTEEQRTLSFFQVFLPLLDRFVIKNLLNF
jgi:hypothetical protein